MNIDYKLSGVMHGEYIELDGMGSADQNSGALTIDLNSVIAPAGWDPALIILICCDNLRLFSAKIPDGHPLRSFRDSIDRLQFGAWTQDHRQGYIVDELGDYVALVKAKGFLWRDGDTLYSRTVVLDGFAHLAQHGGIAQIATPYTETITPIVPGRALGLSKYEVTCADGKHFYGSTQYPYVFDPKAILTADSTLSVNSAKANSAAYLATKAAPKLAAQIVTV